MPFNAQLCLTPYYVYVVVNVHNLGRNNNRTTDQGHHYQSSKIQPDIGHFPIIFSKCPDVINFVRTLCQLKGSVYGYRRLLLFR